MKKKSLKQRQIEIKASLDFLASFNEPHNNSHNHSLKVKKMLENQTIIQLKHNVFAAMENMKGASPEQSKEIATKAITDLKKKLSGYGVKKVYLDTLQQQLDNNIEMANILQQRAERLPGNLTDEAARLNKEELIQPFFECLKIAVGILDEHNTL